MKKYFLFEIFQSAIIRQKAKLVENAISISAEKVVGSDTDTEIQPRFWFPIPNWHTSFSSRIRIGTLFICKVFPGSKKVFSKFSGACVTLL